MEQERVQSTRHSIYKEVMLVKRHTEKLQTSPNSPGVSQDTELKVFILMVVVTLS